MNWRKRVAKKTLTNLGLCFIGLCGMNQTVWAEPARATLAILKLADQPQSQWEEGSYFEPAAIAFTPDGRFAFIIDGYGDTHFLTCLLMRADE